MKPSPCKGKFAFYVDMNTGNRWWVAQLPGQGGVDWGYNKHVHATTTLDKPIPLNNYWRRRFSSDCRQLGRVAHFTETNPVITTTPEEISRNDPNHDGNGVLES